jgi:hypothetical protein
MSPTLGTVRKIKDPMERVKAAATLVEDAQRRGDEARRQRDMYALHLDKVLGWRPVDIVRQVQVSRSLYVRIRDRYPTVLVEKAKSLTGDVPALAKAAGAEAVKWDRIAAEGIEIRDAAIEEAINGGIRNAEVARATGLSTARIAQIRTGN